MAKKRYNTRRPHSGGNRPDPDSDDQFVAGVLEFSTWAKRNQGTLTVVGVVLVAIVAAFIYLGDRQEAKLAEAASRLSTLQASLNMGAQAFLLKGKAQEAVGDLQAAEETFLAVADEARMTFERNEGRAQAARVRTTMGDFAGAAELYESILAGLEPSDPERGLYEMRLGEVEAQALD